MEPGRTRRRRANPATAAPARDQVLADLRNVLEHLDEAEFDGGNAVPGDRSRSLRAPPNSRLAIQTGHRLAFGLIDVNEFERRALAVVASVEDELMEEAPDSWAEMSSGR